MAPDDRPLEDDAGPRKASLAALGLLLLVVTVTFVSGTLRPRRSADEPETWKVVVWLMLFFGAFAVMVVCRP